MDAVRDAANPWVFRRELGEERPFEARAIGILGHGEPTHAVPVDEDAVQAAVTSLRQHEAYLEHIGDHPDPGEFIPEILRAGGEAAGCEYAVTIRLFDLGGLLPES